MKWFDNWLKKRVENASLKEAEWWKQLGFVRPTASGQSVTVDGSLKVSAVYACVRILSETIASLPLKIYERTDSGRTLSDHPLNRVFKAPNSIQTGFEMREFIGTSLTMRGNSYAQKLMNGRGEVQEIVPLYPQHMNVDKDSSGQLVFDYQESGASRAFRQNEIWRIAGMGSNGVTGLSPIGLAREAIGLAMALEEHGATLFKNGTQTDSIFEIPTTLTAEAFDRLKKQIQEHTGSSNSHKSMILEGGLVRKSIGMTAEDSQFIATRKLQIADIARFYRVPLHMLNELDKATFSNIEHQSIEFVRDTITPWLVRIEDSIYRDLLTVSEKQRLFAKHSVNALLRGDIKARFESYGLGIRDGWLSRNEARRLEDMNEESGLDEFILPLNMATEEDRAKNAVISDLVDREIRALKQDKDKGADHFLDFYARFLKKAAAMLGVSNESMVPYGETRMKAIAETGINDTFFNHIAQNGAAEMRAITCQTF